MNIATIATRTIGILYATGVAMLASRVVVELKHKYEVRKHRKAEQPHIDTIEDQLDIAVHRTEITEKYPQCSMFRRQAS